MSSPTSPSNPTPASAASAVPAVVWVHDAEALALEDQAARMAAGALRNQIADLLRVFSLRWVSEFGTLRSKAWGAAFTRLMTDLGRELAAVVVDPAPILADFADRAARLGVVQGFRESGLDRRDLPTPTLPGLPDYAAGVAQAAREKIATAGRLSATLRPGTYNQTVLAAVAPAQQAANIVDRAARTVTNEHLNAGIGAVADYLGGDRLWIAERDACVVCLALSGHLVGPDGLFDADATFGTHPLDWLPELGLTGPPRHPNCRCRLSPWFGHDTEGALSITHDWAGAIAEARANGDMVAEAAAHKAAEAARQSAAFDLPEALRREAERSVLKGWARPSEPNSVRTKAADRLLARIANRGGYAPSGWRVPKSVKKQTERRLRQGSFGSTPFPGN